MSDRFFNRSVVLFCLRIGTALLVLASPLPALAALGTLSLDPAEPTDLDEIQLMIEGQFPTPCWQISEFQFQELQPGVLQLDMFTFELHIVCPQVIVPFETTYELGQLAAGDYEITVIEHRDPMYFWGLTELTLEFTVTEASVDETPMSWGMIKATYR